MAEYKSNICVKKIIDTNAGFLLEEDGVVDEIKKELTVKPLTEKPSPLLISDAILCLECHKRIQDSYLLNTFDYSICDECKDLKTKHKLITKTEAKSKYCLNDCDFDQRGKPIKYILKRNPHNMRWGNMKLYLELQVRERALEIHGSENDLQKVHEEKVAKSENMKAKKFQKKMKELRMSVRSSLWKREDKRDVAHEHDYVSLDVEKESPKRKRSKICETTTQSDGEDDACKKVCTICGQEAYVETL